VIGFVTSLAKLSDRCSTAQVIKVNVSSVTSASPLCTPSLSCF